MKNSWLIILFSSIVVSGYSQHKPFSNSYRTAFQKTIDFPGEEFGPVFSTQIKYRTDQPQPIKETYWQWETGIDTLKQFARFLNTYNPLGLLIGSVFQTWENDHWHDELKMSQIFNEHQQEKS